MIEELAEFSFNAPLLLREFNKVKSQYNGETDRIKRLRITFSDYDNESAPPYQAYSFRCIPAKQELAEGKSSSWNVNNILKPFQGSYTESVVKELNDWFKPMGTRITVAKYAELIPSQAFGLHSDLYKFRYHIPITTNEGCMFYIDKNLYFMDKVNYLYKMQTDVEHACWNVGHTSRLHLILDTVEIV